MGHFQLFSMYFEIFNGPFLIILHRLLWAIFQVNGTIWPLAFQITVSLASMKVPFPCLFCIKLHDFKQFKQKNPLTPPPYCEITYEYIHFTKLKQTPRMWFCLAKTPRDVILIKIIVCRAVSRAKINFDDAKAE